MNNLGKTKKKQMEEQERKTPGVHEMVIRKCKSWQRWRPGFCSGPNHSCIEILRALNTENIIVTPYITENKNLLSHKVSARKFCFSIMTTSAFLLKAEQVNSLGLGIEGWEPSS